MAPSTVLSDDGYDIAPTSPSVIQGLSIRHHVPVIIDMDEGNFRQWRLFFKSTLGKFGLLHYVRFTTPSADRNGEWRRIYSCIVNWILSTVSTPSTSSAPSAAIVTMPSPCGTPSKIYSRTMRCSASSTWRQLRSLQQGDMTMNDYCTKLKRIVDQLRDIGHPISEPSQVLNLLRGLNPRYRYVKPVITSKYPPHTFQSARSFLILEDLSAQHNAISDANQALHADSSNNSSNSASSGNKDGSSSSNAS
jgi:hypothetical protein